MSHGRCLSGASGAGPTRAEAHGGAPARVSFRAAPLARTTATHLHRHIRPLLRAPPDADDLAPFVAPLVGPGRSQDEMILAHTRVTLSHDGSRLFSARR